MKKTHLSLLATILIWFVGLQAFSQKETKSLWNNFEKLDFVFEGKDAIIVTPKKEAKGKPWIFRPAFFGAFAQADAGLLQKGWHVVYLDLTHQYGSPNAINRFNSFYNELVNNRGFSPKVTLEGLSRGGLFVMNWAKTNPSKVASIYIDAPVCNLKSWPGRKNATLWNDFLKEYQITDKQADDFKGNAHDNLDDLAEAGIPILCVSGDADKVVPYIENAAIVRTNWMNLGGNMRTILKPGGDHHPHALPDSTPIIQFVTQHTAEYQKYNHINLRNNLNNSRFIFEKTKKGRVAFLGGSITETKGWRNAVCEELKQRFPDTEFDFVVAGISSMGSTPHAFRFQNDVLKNGNVDLLFVEAAVNDHTNFFTPKEQIRGMEGIVRQALMNNQNMDIVMLHFMHDPFLDIIKAGKTPDVILNHEKVANFYNIPSIDLAQEIAERIGAGELSWQEFGGTHPSPYGHTFYAAAISSLFDKMWSSKYFKNNKIKAHSFSKKPLDPYSYYEGQLIDIHQAKIIKGWKIETPWTPKTNGEVRTRFTNLNVLEALNSGDELSFDFQGTAIGIFTLAGPDAGIIEYSVDNKPFKKLDLFTIWSSGLYIPWVYMFETELPNQNHTIKLKMASENNSKSIGHACHIYYFAVNGE